MQQVELIEFYPIKIDLEKGLLSGTLKIRIADLELNILGVYAVKRKDYWFFSLPCQYGIDKGGEKIRYPCISFDQKRHKKLMNDIRKLAPAFIMQRVQEFENPVIIQVQLKEEIKLPHQEPRADSPREVAVKRPLSKEGGPAKPSKVWVDPPSRKGARLRKASS